MRTSTGTALHGHSPCPGFKETPASGIVGIMYTKGRWGQARPEQERGARRDELRRDRAEGPGRGASRVTPTPTATKERAGRAWPYSYFFDSMNWSSYADMPYGRTKKSYGKRTTAARKYTRSGKKSTSGKSRYYKSRAPRKTLALRQKWFNPDCQRLMLKFTYTDTGFSRTLNSANAWSSSYVFRGNGPFDPDYTGAGVQPYSFDQYLGAALYTNYHTKSSSIRVYFHPNQAYADIRRLHAMLIPTRQYSFNVNDPSDLRMMPFAQETTYDGETESTKGAKMKAYASSRKVIPEFNQDSYSYSAVYNGTPSSQWYWHVIFWTDMYTSSEAPEIIFDVKIRYYTICSRSNLPQES